MVGEKLLHDIALATGLPNDLISSELSRLIEDAGLCRETLTIEDMRKVLANYVQDVLLSAQQEFSKEA